MDRSRIALIIPALNEAKTIGPVVRRSSDFGLPIVVNDGSTDDTATVARDAGADVVTLAENRGYDGALNAGFERAAALDLEVAITLDADGQHDPELVRRFVDALAQGADVVVGIRDRRQRLAEHLYAWSARWLWGLQDPLCGMKAYRMEVYRANGWFDSCDSIGTELAICSGVRGFKVEQIPVPTRPRADAPRFGRAFRANVRIARALFAVAAKARHIRRGRTVSGTPGASS